MYNYYPKNDSPQGHGRVSFAGVVENNVLKVGVAVCGRKETYNKKRGRTIAQARAAKKPFFELPVEGLDNKQIGTSFITLCKNTEIHVPYGTGEKMMIMSLVER